MSLNVVVTGANRGIGLALCQYFHRIHYDVYGVCRQASLELDKISKNIIKGIDIRKKDDIDLLSRKLSNIKIHVLVNNAGIFLDENFGNIDFDSIEKQFQVNALGTLRVTESLIGNLCQNSKIALITSRMGSIDDNNSGGRYGYRMSKAALNALGKSLAIDLKPKGISVGIFHPGFVATDMVQGRGDISSQEAAKRLVSLLNDLNISNSGTFWHSNGEVLPW